MFDEEEKKSAYYTLQTVKELLKAIDKELEKENAYKYYVAEKLDGAIWRLKYINRLCKEEEDDKC